AADHSAALAAGGDGHVAADKEGEPAEHLLLGQLGIAADELPDTPGEFLVVGHGDDRTDRGIRGGRAPRADPGGQPGVRPAMSSLGRRARVPTRAGRTLWLW